MKAPLFAVVSILCLLIVACAPAPRRSAIATRPAVSATALEYQRAKLEAEQDRAAEATAATQKQIDALKQEVEALKQQNAGTRDRNTAATTYLDQLRKNQAARESRVPAVSAPVPSPNAKAIDAEVAKIMAGDHGQLPPAQKVSSNNSGVASIRVTNDTAHTLTVSYSGPTTKRSILAPHKSESVTLSSGAYDVAASVDDPTVIPFAGKDTLSGGDYTNSFYIVTSTQ